MSRRSYLTPKSPVRPQELGAMGYKFQFVTLAGFHSLNFGMFELASGYAKRGMASYAELQQVRIPCAHVHLTVTYHRGTWEPIAQGFRRVGGCCHTPTFSVV